MTDWNFTLELQEILGLPIEQLISNPIRHSAITSDNIIHLISICSIFFDSYKPLETGFMNTTFFTCKRNDFLDFYWLIKTIHYYISSRNFNKWNIV